MSWAGRKEVPQILNTLQTLDESTWKSTINAFQIKLKFIANLYSDMVPKQETLLKLAVSVICIQKTTLMHSSVKNIPSRRFWTRQWSMHHSPNCNVVLYVLRSHSCLPLRKFQTQKLGETNADVIFRLVTEQVLLLSSLRNFLMPDHTSKAKQY